MYKKLDKKPCFPKIQEGILKQWKENGIKQKVINMNKDTGEVFSFYEGPPTANGNPHAGHVLTRSLKDVYTRFAGMNGRYVPRKGGWDTHGLPVEISVEKSLHISGKQDIEEYGVENFINACKKNVWLCIDRWKEFSEMVGYSLDLDDDCYNPYENKYIESVWWSLDQFNQKGLLYKGHKILPSCPSCQTALSSQEVAQGYKDRKDMTVVAKFPCEELGASFLAWTTTPWTLPSNVGLCVNPDFDYVMVSSNQDGQKYILAEGLLSKHFKDDTSYEIVKRYKGSELTGKKYEPLFDFAGVDRENAYRVVSDGYVTLEEGTGIVHIAPAYGEDDNRVSSEWGLPFVQLVNQAGIFSDECGKYAGKFVFDENEDINTEIVMDLIEQGKAFSKAKHVHSYPHCWRCKTPLIYFARDAWFIKTTAYKDELIKANDEINWFPESFKKGRMGNFLENNVDWCLSRDRYWGTPLNVWMCECGNYKTIASIRELVELSGCDENIELHKPYIDEVKIKCDKCGREMTRESEVIDVWYDSGAMPFAQFHYPFENQEEFKRRFPAEFVFEGYDQTRGWFYTLEAINTALFGRAPMKNCLANGMICDANGYKMSKSKGNYTDPMEFIKKYGGDVVRFMFYSNAQPYNDVIFSEGLLIDCQRKFLDVLYNNYSFYVLYAEINNFAGGGKTVGEVSLSLMDRYILSKLNNLIANVSREVAAYRATEASRMLITFCDELSNWYIRRCRRRFYNIEENHDDSEAAFVTLYTVLSTFAKVCAPFIPFITDEIYQTIERPFVEGSPESVHLCKYPVADEKYIDPELEELMSKTYRFCELGRAARQTAGIKVKQPLRRIYINDESPDAPTLNDEYRDIILDELNIKEIEENADISGFVSYTIKPQLKTLGPKYGKILNKIKEYLANCDAKAVRDCVKTGGVWKFDIDSTTVELEETDLLISSEEKEGFIGSSSEQYTVILDIHLDDELMREGYCREIISKIQKMRKDAGYEILDHIEAAIDGDDKICGTVVQFAGEISKEILAKSFSVGKLDGDGVYTDSVNLDDRDIAISIRRV